MAEPAPMFFTVVYEGFRQEEDGVSFAAKTLNGRPMPHRFRYVTDMVNMIIALKRGALLDVIFASKCHSLSPSGELVLTDLFRPRAADYPNPM